MEGEAGRDSPRASPTAGLRLLSATAAGASVDSRGSAIEAAREWEAWGAGRLPEARGSAAASGCPWAWAGPCRCCGVGRGLSATFGAMMDGALADAYYSGTSPTSCTSKASTPPASPTRSPPSASAPIARPRLALLRPGEPPRLPARPRGLGVESEAAALGPAAAASATGPAP